MAEAADRLEPFLLMARSTKGAAAAKIVQTATAAVSVSIHILQLWPAEAYEVSLCSLVYTGLESCSMFPISNR
jgi:hypothetical protein